MVLSACLALPASALIIRGDARWRGIEPCPDNWADPNLDDSAWGPVAYPWIFIWPRDSPLPDARPFWTTTNRPSCARRHFTLTDVPSGPAWVEIWVDDDYELYLNGTFVGASNDQAATPPGERYDVAPLLRRGDNVVALKLIACSGEEQAAIFLLNIPEVSDEGATLAELLVTVTPWVTFLGIAAAALLVFAGVRIVSRRAAVWIRRLPPLAAVVAIVAVLVVCQWLLQTGQLYSIAAHPGSPWAAWDWPQVLIVGLALSLLVVLGTWECESTTRARGEWLVLAGILLLAVLLRVVALDSVPTGFFQDEAVNANDAVALFEGRPLELWSDSIGGRPTLFLYLLGASMQVAGRSYLALKIVPVSFGVASVLALYILGRIALGPRPALWGAFFLAISWWHIMYSRMAWEVNCVPFFSSVGMALLLSGLGPSRHRWWTLTSAGAVLSLGMYTYAAYRAIPAAVVIFLMATALSADRRVLHERAGPLVTAGLVAFAVFLPLLIFGWQHPELYWRRYEDVSLTKYMTYHGTPVPWLHQLGKALLGLHQRGHESLPLPPYLDAVTGACLLLGLTVRVPAERRRGSRLLWSWSLTFLALSSLTRDAPHITRLLGLLPPVVLFAGFGAARLIDCLRAAVRIRVLVWACVTTVVLVALALNTYRYFIEYQNLPDTDLRNNVRARLLCEVFREAVPARLYWTYDLEYWAGPQCRFLVPREFMPRMVGVAELRDPQALTSGDGPVVVAVGGEFMDRYIREIPHDDNNDPRFDFPVRPTLYLDREARRLYYLYKFSP